MVWGVDIHYEGFLGGYKGKESICNAGDLSLIPGSGRYHREGHLPTPVFLPGEFHGQRSPADYSPQHCKKLNTTECIGLKHAFVGKFVFGRAPK